MIPRRTLTAWSHLGAKTSADLTLRSIRRAIGQVEWPTEAVVSVYAQGSYTNWTNIRADSDVDVVVEMSEESMMSGGEIGLLDWLGRQLSSNWLYSLFNFRSDVEKVLREYYGRASVDEKSKCFEVETSHLCADVVPCIAFKDDEGNRGMALWCDLNQEHVVNYPVLHRQNGIAKSKRTHKRYKRTIRMFKNAKRKLVEDFNLWVDTAPSYFIECLLYNVPDRLYHYDLVVTFEGILDYLAEAEIERYMMQNGIRELFGPGNDQWDVDNAIEYLEGLNDIWRNGPI